jgi:hypothetical protein
MPHNGLSQSMHDRALQRERRRAQNSPPLDEQIERRLIDLVHPATLEQVTHFHAAGLRERVLNLPVMVSFVISMIWRHLGSVSEAVRVLDQEGMLWTSPLSVRQQSVSQRLNRLPEQLFKAIVDDLLPVFDQRNRDRTRRLQPHLAYVGTQFSRICSVDGSTLEAMLKKTALLASRPEAASPQIPILGGKIITILDVCSRLPSQILFDDDVDRHEAAHLDWVSEHLEKNALVLFDLGFVKHSWFDQLTEQQRWFLTRAKTRLCFQVDEVLVETPTLRDQIVRIGDRKHRCQSRLRCRDGCRRLC